VAELELASWNGPIQRHTVGTTADEMEAFLEKNMAPFTIMTHLAGKTN